MCSKNNKKINSIIKIPSRIKSPGKYALLIRTSLKRKWKSLWRTPNWLRKCSKGKSTVRPQSPLKTPSATSRTSSETFKNSKLQSTSVLPCLTNWPSLFRLKVNKSTPFKPMSQVQKITLKRPRRSCKKPRSIINVLKSVSALASLLDWSSSLSSLSSSWWRQKNDKTEARRSELMVEKDKFSVYFCLRFLIFMDWIWN